MRKNATTSAPAADAEMPSQGGSYVRQEDGSLKRVEFTEHAAPAHADTPVESEPPVGGEKES